MTFGEKVRNERNRLGLSQDELAKQIGVSRRVISSYENDSSRPRGTERYQKLADSLGVNINYLLSEDEAFIANVEDNYGRRGVKQAKELLAEAGYPDGYDLRITVNTKYPTSVTIGTAVQAQMKEAGICTYAAHLEGKNSYDEEDYRKASAFLIGNEGNGLRDEVAEQAQVYIRIPMKGQVESLNAAVATAILTFEAARQRR